MSYRHLTESERAVIFYLRMDHRSQAEIARKLGRHPGTISRECRRNSSPMGHYLPDIAHRLAAQRSRQGRARLRTADAELMAHVEDKFQARWSPQQIAGRIKLAPPLHLAGVTISHATIYRWIWACPQRSQRLRPLLRVAHKKRRKPYGKPSRRGHIPNRVSIDQRPQVVEQRTRLGDWEGDTIVGKGRSGYVMTNVDRASRYTVARKLDRATGESATAALHQAMRRLPADRRRTQTFDNGKEFAGHQDIARLLGLAVYFAHPYSSWERGTNENTNGLLRQYLPKNADFAQLTAWQLESTIRQLNDRPRKCLHYRTPAEVFWRRSVALVM